VKLNQLNLGAVSWSGGKDSTLALYEIQNKNILVSQLFTTINQKYGRVVAHEVRENLLEIQCNQLGIPLKKIYLSEKHSTQEYDQEMNKAFIDCQNSGIETIVYGDIFLEDLKQYRESELKKAHLSGEFPLWKKDSKYLLEKFIQLGFKAILVAVNENLLDPVFLGRVLDLSFIHDLPPEVDPCGENGEYHTFVFDGPLFRKPVSFSLGEIQRRTYTRDKKEIGIHFLDLIPD
jgi:uncharacterized protein (TIGR00290 family)